VSRSAAAAGAASIGNGEIQIAEPCEFASPISNSSPYYSSSTIPAHGGGNVRDFDHLSHNSPSHSSLEQRRNRVGAGGVSERIVNVNGIESSANHNQKSKEKEKKMAERVRYLHERGPSSSFGQFFYMKKFGVLIFLFQILFIVLFALFVRYGKESDAVHAAVANPVESPLRSHPGDDDRLATTGQPHSNHTEEKHPLENYYPMFQDIHVMMFIGFGFLMTFLKRYGFSAVGINFVLAAFVLQWAMLVGGWFDLHDGYIQIGVTELIASDFAAAAVLISMGALLGKLSPEQYIVMGFLEVVFYTVNEYILFDLWTVTDAGDSMTVHTFGAYFGLTVARVMYRKGTVGHPREGSSYHSDIFAMIGTIFLWVFWPSFNGGLATGDQRHRAVLNTYISLAACCLVSYGVSALLNHENKFDMVHVQNSTLAGGVAIGTSANLMIQPFGAMLVGSIAGVVSVVGYKYITPFLARKLNLHDTCGVNNLHGIPGILAAIIGAIVCGFASFDTYGHNLFEVFPALKDGRTAWGQTGYQFAGLGVTLAMAIGGGLITGFILRLPIWIQLDEQSYYDDEDFWEVPHESVELEQGQLYMAKRDTNGEMELEKVQHGHHYA